jgi:hypothetical protein
MWRCMSQGHEQEHSGMLTVALHTLGHTWQSFTLAESFYVQLC